MPRIRFIKHEFFMDDDLAVIPHLSRLAFIGLWTLADREGRLEDKPMKIKAMLFPYENIEMDGVLNTLVGKFIGRYEVDGKRFIQINNFLKHQRPHVKEVAGKFPPMPRKAPEKPGRVGAKTPDSGVRITDSGFVVTDSGLNNRGEAPIDLKNEIAKIAKHLSQTVEQRTGDYSDYRLPKNFGRYGGAYVVNVPADECVFLIEKMNPGPKVRAALQWRIDLKSAEMTR